MHLPVLQKQKELNTTINKVGFVSGIIAFVSTVAYDIVQLMQVLVVLHYPLDEILIYGTSLCIAIPFVLEILALHYATPGGKKYWSNAALIFSVIYSTFVTANYVVQLATVISMKVRSAGNEINILEQLPHSLF